MTFLFAGDIDFGEAPHVGLCVQPNLILSAELIQEFYARVTLHDYRSMSLREVSSLQSLLAHLPVQPLGRAATAVELPTAAEELFPTPRSGFPIRSDSLRDPYGHILPLIRRFGGKTPPDNEGHYRQEVWQLTVCLSSIEAPIGQAAWDVGDTVRARYESVRTVSGKHGSTSACERAIGG